MGERNLVVVVCSVCMVCTVVFLAAYNYWMAMIGAIVAHISGVYTAYAVGFPKVESKRPPGLCVKTFFFSFLWCLLVGLFVSISLALSGHSFGGGVFAVLFVSSLAMFINLPLMGMWPLLQSPMDRLIAIVETSHRERFANAKMAGRFGLVTVTIIVPLAWLTLSWFLR